MPIFAPIQILHFVTLSIGTQIGVLVVRHLVLVLRVQFRKIRKLVFWAQHRVPGPPFGTGIQCDNPQLR